MSIPPIGSEPEEQGARLSLLYRVSRSFSELIELDGRAVRIDALPETLPHPSALHHGARDEGREALDEERKAWRDEGD